MRRQEKLKGGLEEDALTRWRRFLHWRPGERKWIKRKYNKRMRKIARLMATQEEAGG